jgi:hypothetical protein
MPEVFPAFLIGVILLLPFFFLATTSHDRLVRRLYEQHREDWKKAGGPKGFFWSPPEKLPSTALMAFMKSSMTWAFRPPAPLSGDPECRKHLVRLRVGLLVWNLGCLTLFGILYKAYGFPPA